MRNKAIGITLLAAVLVLSGCGGGKITLAPGGVYSDPVLAVTDQAILDANTALTGFVSWANANATYLAKWPEIASLASKVTVNQNTWIKDAFTARDTYAQAAAAYKAAGSTGSPPSQAGIQAALAVMTNVTAQIAAYQAAHPIAAPPAPAPATN